MLPFIPLEIFTSDKTHFYSRTDDQKDVQLVIGGSRDITISNFLHLAVAARWIRCLGDRGVNDPDSLWRTYALVIRIVVCL